MKKKILSLALVFSALGFSAFAEQPQAQDYRNILAGNKFYVEYNTEYEKKIVAAENGKRVEYTTFSSGSVFGFGLNLGALFAGKPAPTTLYQDGKYYQFNGRKKAVMAYWNQLDDPNINPKEYWYGVKYKLALPEEFAIFNYTDPFYQEVYGGARPVFVESGKKKIKDIEYDYDKYSMNIYALAGNVLQARYYYAYYLNGELKSLASCFADNKGKEYLSNEIMIKRLQAEVPPNTIYIPKGCKIYAAGIGDMNDLIEKPVLVEEYK